MGEKVVCYGSHSEDMWHMQECILKTTETLQEEEGMEGGLQKFQNTRKIGQFDMLVLCNIIIIVYCLGFCRRQYHLPSGVTKIKYDECDVCHVPLLPNR
jgi:hypothetical protein